VAWQNLKWPDRFGCE